MQNSHLLDEILEHIHLCNRSAIHFHAPIIEKQINRNIAVTQSTERNLLCVTDWVLIVVMGSIDHVSAYNSVHVSASICGLKSNL